MIDSIKIILKDFSGNFEGENIKPRRRNFIKTEDDKYNYDNYSLYGKSSYDNHCLKVSKNNNTGKVTIVGSIRKLAYSRVSFLDMPQQTFVKTLKYIAESLNIPFEELKKAEFTNCEIGANINTRIPAIDVLPLAVEYAHYKRDDGLIEEGTLYFTGSDRTLKLYVKDNEIAGRGATEEIIARKRKSFDVLKSKGFHLLRIEFTLKNHRAVRNAKMGHIKTMGDLIDNYSDLYDFWTREVRRIVIYNRLKYKEEELTKKEKEIVDGLEALDFFSFVEDYQNTCMSRTSTSKSAKSAKSDAFNSILKVLNKYYDNKEYHHINFRVDAVKYLIRKSKRNKLNLPPLIYNLLGKASNKANIADTNKI